MVEGFRDGEETTDGNIVKKDEFRVDREGILEGKIVGKNELSGIVGFAV